MIDPAAVLRAFAELSAGADDTRSSPAAADLLWLGGVLNREATPTRAHEVVGQVVGRPAVDHVVLPGGVVTGAHPLLGTLCDQAKERTNGFVELGWCWAVGHDGSGQAVCRPLASRSARLLQNSSLARAANLAGELAGHVPLSTGRYTLDWSGDWYLDLEPSVGEVARRRDRLRPIPLDLFIDPVIDPDLLDRLPKLAGWARSVALEAGFPADDIVVDHPAVHAEDEGITVCVGFGLRLPGGAMANVEAPHPLTRWASTDGIADTAFAALLVDGSDDTPGGDPDPDARAAVDRGSPAPLSSPLPLDANQRRVVEVARQRRIVTVSGPPGTGKSHTVIALAMDTIRRGGSVLVATRSVEAADVLAEQLGRQPGPVPIRFGSRDAREASLADIERRLADHQPAAMARLAADAADTEARLRAEVTERVARMGDAATYPAMEALMPSLMADAPGCFDGSADLDTIERLAVEAAAPSEGIGGRWHHRSAMHRLHDAVGAEVDPETARRAVRAARARRAVDRLEGCDDEVRALWDQLEQAERENRHWLGRMLDELLLQRAESASGRAALSTVRAALLAGGRTRHVVMGELDPAHLAEAAPLWLGTLGEVESLLPHQPGLFELVIIDEASQVDQAVAAPALLRARRAAVFGDPRQLSHVSFVSDADQTRTLAAHGLDDAGARFDLRRTSQLDAAAIASPVIWLDEHHRSVPHLIGFSLARFYDGHVTLASRHPGNECTIAIDVDRSNDSTTDAVVRVVVDRVRSGARSVGVITPFRDAAEQIAATLATQLTAPEQATADMRVGTVHAFQGAERDVVVVAPDLSAEGDGSRRRFVEDPHLFNVMVTRARTSMVVVVPEADQPAGLLADLLAWAAVAPPAEPDHPPTSPDAARVAAVLRDGGRVARTSYPVGDWTVDVCVGTDRRAVAVMVGAHPDGPDAHVERHLALRRAGWRVVDPVLVDPEHPDTAVTGAVGLVSSLLPSASGPIDPG